MLCVLETDIEKIQMYLQQIGFVFEKKNPAQNKIIAINYRLKEISTVLTGQSEEKLFQNVEMVTGAVTATYSSIQTLKQATVSIRKTRNYVEEYLKI